MGSVAGGVDVSGWAGRVANIGGASKSRASYKVLLEGERFKCECEWWISML